MNYWILKTEPSSYSYDQLERDKKTVWDGVSLLGFSRVRGFNPS